MSAYNFLNFHRQQIDYAVVKKILIGAFRPDLLSFRSNPRENTRAIKPPSGTMQKIKTLFSPIKILFTFCFAVIVIALCAARMNAMAGEKIEKTSAGEKNDTVSAKALFSAEKLPTIGKAVAIGYYPRGCLAGGIELPIDGPNWQVMRVSRNRNWGHPELINFLKRFSGLAAKVTGWHGILIGDMAQPRGGPLPFGHLSHQIGLDVDIWFMPMPDHTLSKEEREKISATNLVADDGLHVNPKTWTLQDIAFIRTAAQQPEVERVLVNAAIKKELCRAEGKESESWMSKIRPWYGHADHIHVRLKCPADSPDCRHQPPVPAGDQCGKELDYWFSDKILHPKLLPKPAEPKRELTLADLPPACKSVLSSPTKSSNN
jgi:penicillin-insensitive murein DD-endopeptidase